MWINESTQEIYRLHSEFRAAFPNTSFPSALTDEIMSAFGVVSVRMTPKPQPDHTKNVSEGAPNLVDGVWEQVWVVTDASAAEVAERVLKKSSEVRQKRDRLLSETDWMALSDTTLAPEWASYRQALRDITSQSGFPYDVTWPEKPSF